AKQVERLARRRIDRPPGAQDETPLRLRELVLGWIGKVLVVQESASASFASVSSREFPGRKASPSYRSQGEMPLALPCWCRVSGFAPWPGRHYAGTPRYEPRADGA